jgi:hypothetical protein
MKQAMLLLCVCTTYFFSWSQKYQIQDAETKESIPFVKVYPNVGKPVLADLGGYYERGENVTEVTLKMMGYRDTTIVLDPTNLVLFLMEQASELEEVTILPGVNPAERIMEQAIKNRKSNHPKSDVSFTCNTYSKFMFTMDQDALASISDTTTDSNLVDLKRFFGKQHLFLLESTSKKYFKPPFKEKEVITAYRVSGFNDPMFSTFANQLQSFNFYDNQFDILGKSYLNPLALGSIRRYLFILEDTIFNPSGDTTYIIRFQPRRDKNFDGMKGTLYINTDRFAIEKVIAEPAVKEGGLAYPTIVQEYARIEGKWFPVKLSTEAIMTSLKLDSKLEKGYLVGKGNTYIEDVVLNADMKDTRFNAVFIETEIDANNKDSVHWENNRNTSLSEKERMTYTVIDSVSQAENLNGKLELLQSLAQGKIPLGYFQLPITRIINYREYEGFRLGAGIETSPKLSKRFMVGGYGAYGFRDKMFKYGGYTRFRILPRQFFDVELRYQEDIVERGGTEWVSESMGFTQNSLYRNFYVAQMDKQRLGELAFTGYIFPRLKFRMAGTYQRIGFTEGYKYTWRDTTMNYKTGFENAEASLELIWSIREKVISLGTKRVSMGSKWPILSLKIAQSIPELSKDKVNYTRASVKIFQNINIRAVGRFSYLLVGQTSSGDVPLLFQHVATGTGRNWNLSVENTFETMPASSYYSKSLGAAFIRFEFKELKTNKKWTAPQFGIHHGYGIGDKPDFANHTIPYYSLEKGYAEAGAYVHSLIVLNSIGFGVGGFYHYYGNISPYFKDNFTAKVCLKIRLIN